MILHRDIKPDNILIDKNGKLKLADFGLAKKASFLQRRKSNQIVSLWYRAPEIILGSEDYLCCVDMWSIGCVFAELFWGRPVFMCENGDQVLNKVFYLLTCPTESNAPVYLEMPQYSKQRFANWVHYKEPKIEKTFHNMPPDAMDLLKKILHLDPAKRILAREALAHPFL